MLRFTMYLPKTLNDSVLAVSAIVGVYAGYRSYRGGGPIWQVILGACAFLFFSSLYQIWKPSR